MKSRTLSCKLTPFKKDITRFAPVWVLYFIGGLMVMLTSTDSTNGGTNASAMAESISWLSIANLVYAGIVAQVLFGDLYQSRLCNALHAMPLRRETWFLNHVAAGLCFSLVPHLAALPILMLRMEQFWFIGLIWLLGVTLQYLFFFGLAVFSCLCVGNRVAMAAVYGILNFGSLVALWFCNSIYEPLMEGVSITTDGFFRCCPVVTMVSNSDMVLGERIRQTPDGPRVWNYLGFGQGWDYLAICAVLGVVLLGLALLIYRRRALESAGNFISVKPLVPIFQVVFTLCAGVVCSMFGGIMDAQWVFFIAGILVGWFVGRMLLNRTTRVFQPKAFLGLGILAAALVLSVLLVKWDAFGIVRWVPEPEDVESVQFTGRDITVSAPEDIEAITQIHQEAVTNRYSENYPTQMVDHFYLRITYTLKSGAVRERYYHIPRTSPSWNALKRVLGNEEAVFGNFTDWEQFMATIKDVNISGKEVEGDFRSLLEAMRLDCQEGNMAQYPVFHPGEEPGYVNLHIRETNTIAYVHQIQVYGDCAHTMQWLKDNGYSLEGEKYEDTIFYG